jgi:hypothetical protein
VGDTFSTPKKCAEPYETLVYFYNLKLFTLLIGWAIDITYSRPLKRQFPYCIDRFPPWNVGDATILLSEKGWREGTKVVSILPTAFLYIK